jgi:hypothetical protein
VEEFVRRQLDQWKTNACGQHTQEEKKTNTSKISNVNNDLEFTINAQSKPKIALFFKFDDLYFNDFNSKVAALGAQAIKLKDQKMKIKFISLNNQPNAMKKKHWKNSIQQFLSDYLSHFSTQVLSLPFKRDDPQTANIMYDKNTLEVAWCSQTELHIFGLKSEIENFKQRIFNLCN